MKQNQYRDLLLDTLLNITDKEHLEKLLSSLCTEKELDKMAQRLKVAQMFMSGAKYRDIVNETNASTATLAKIKYDLFYGKKGLVNV